MFNKDVKISGKHSYFMDELKNQGFFKRHIDIYMQAAIIGFQYNRRSLINKTGDYSDKTTSIFTETILGEQQNLFFIYRLIILLDNSNESLDERINRAFRDDSLAEVSNNHEENLKVYNSYVLGGIEILYEKIIEKGATDLDYIKNSFEFIREQHLAITSQSADDLLNDL